jgi:hypothetical protein
MFRSETSVREPRYSIGILPNANREPYTPNRDLCFGREISSLGIAPNKRFLKSGLFLDMYIAVRYMLQGTISRSQVRRGATAREGGFLSDVGAPRLGRKRLAKL